MCEEGGWTTEGRVAENTKGVREIRPLDHACIIKIYNLHRDMTWTTILIVFSILIRDRGTIVEKPDLQ